MALFVELIVFWLVTVNASSNRYTEASMNAAAPRPADSSSHTFSSGSESSSGGGVNVLAAMLVAASSVMVFMAFRLSICRCRKSGPSSEAGTDEEFEGGQSELENGTGGAETTTPAPLTAAGEKKRKKRVSLGVDWIDKFTRVAEFGSLGLFGSTGCCSVCLSEFASAHEQVRLLPACNHFFHPDCIDLWLLSHMSCPVCRHSVVPSGKLGASSSDL